MEVGGNAQDSRYWETRKRCLVEAIWQLNCCGQNSSVKVLLSLPSVTQLLYENCKLNLIKAWRVSGGAKGYVIAAENYVKECSWLLFQDSVGDTIDHEWSVDLPMEMKNCLSKILATEKLFMRKASLSNRINMVKLVCDFLIQIAEYSAASQVLDMLLQCSENEIERIGIIVEQARMCLILSRFSEGISLCEQIVKSSYYNDSQSANHEDIPAVKKSRTSSAYSDITYALAKLYSANGEFCAADPLFQSVLDHRVAVFGENRSQTADILCDIARHKFNQRLYIESLELFQRVLAIRRVTAGERSPSFISAIRDIGKIYCDLAEYDKAERYFINALQATELVFGETHPSVADVLNELAFSKYKREKTDIKKLDEIIAMYERTLSIRISCYGDMHIDVANTLNHLANTYRTKFDLGDHEAISQAIEIYNRARVIKETNLHPKHPEVLLSRNNLGIILLMSKKYAEAAAEHEALLSIRQEIFGVDNIQVATSFKNCGLAYMGLENYEKSLEYHLSALRIRQDGFGLAHPKTAESEVCIGDVYVKMGQALKAIPHYEAAVSAWNSVLGDYNADSLKCVKLIEDLKNGVAVTEPLFQFM